MLKTENRTFMKLEERTGTIGWKNDPPDNQAENSAHSSDAKQVLDELMKIIESLHLEHVTMTPCQASLSKRPCLQLEFQNSQQLLNGLDKVPEWFKHVASFTFRVLF